MSLALNENGCHMRKIKKVKLTKFLNHKEIVFEANPKVNIITGLHGCGKSLLLKTLSDIVTKQSNNSFKEHSIQIDDDCLIIKDQSVEDNSHLKKTLTNTVNLMVHNPESFSVTHHIINSVYVSFQENNLITSSEVSNLIYSPLIKTHLDFILHLAQCDFNNYRLNILKKYQYEILTKDTSLENVKHLLAPKITFEKIINNCFFDKRITYCDDKNEILFEYKNKTLTAYDLSFYEKQLLILLLIALNQNNKETILFIDEPLANSIWKTKIVDFMFQLNPNLQLFIASSEPNFQRGDTLLLD